MTATTSTTLAIVSDISSKGFKAAAWRKELNTVCGAEAGSVKRMVELVLIARDAGFCPDAAREAFTEAYGLGYAASFGAPFEAVIKSKTVLNRVSDAMAIFNAKVLPGSLPSTLQAAAKACRAANPKTSGAGSKSGKATGGAVPATANGFALLTAALEAVRKECGDNEAALEVVASLADLADDLLVALTQEQADSVDDMVA